MNNSGISRITGTSAILYMAMTFSTVLHAGYITGQFSLVQDHDNPNGIDQGELVASVSFTADDTPTTNAKGLSVFDVTRLELIDRTPDLDRDDNGSADGVSLIGNFLYEADMTMPAGMAPLKAFYSPTSALVGLHGRVHEGDMMIGKMFSFWVHGTTLSESTALRAVDKINLH